MRKSTIIKNYERVLKEREELMLLREEYSKKVDNAYNKLQKLKEKVENLENDLELLRNQRDAVGSKIWELDHDNSELEMEYKLITIVQPVINVTFLNSLWVNFFHETRTIDLMDEFYYSDYEYLILSDVIQEDSYPGSFSNASYIISRIYPQDSFIYSGLAISDLKKYLKPNALTDYFYDDPDERDRIYPLFKYIFNIYNQYGKIPYSAHNNLKYSGKAILFEKAIDLGCQLSVDKYNRGFKNGVNREYGETSSFYIVGCIVNDPYFYHAYRVRNNINQ